MLLFTASMDGQGAIAMQAARDYDKFDRDHIYPLLTFIRFGRFDEILEISKPASQPAAAVWEFGQGYARLRKGEKEVVHAHLKRLAEAAANPSGMFRINSAANVLGILTGILEGEIYRAEGNLNKAIESFERGVAREDAMIYDEPEPLPFSARHWLGAALLEAKAYADAERVYREELKKHPHNGWSLCGLQQALEKQGKPTQPVADDLASSRARSDTWIRSSIF